MKKRIKYLFVLMVIAIILNSSNIIIGIIAKQYISSFGSFVTCWAIFELGRALYIWQKFDKQCNYKKITDLRIENIKRFGEIIKRDEILRQICFKFNVVASFAEFNRFMIGADSELIALKILERIKTHKAVCNEQKG